MAAVCPKCGRTLVGAGVCPSGDYRAPSTKPKTSPVAPVVPTPTRYTPPEPVAYTPPPPVAYATPDPVAAAPVFPSPAPVAPPSPSAYVPPSTSGGAPAASAAPTGPTQNAFGGVRIRGRIDEIGTERSESVSLAGSQAMGNAAVGALTAIPRAIGIVLGLLFAPLRMLLIPSLMAGGRRQNGPDQLHVPVTPFVVRSDDGIEYDCMLRGEARGGFLKLGEPVEVVGRIDRSRVVRVDHVQSLRTNAITKGWVDPRARMAKAQTVAGIILIVFLVIFLISISSWFAGR